MGGRAGVLTPPRCSPRRWGARSVVGTRGPTWERTGAHERDERAGRDAAVRVLHDARHLVPVEVAVETDTQPPAVTHVGRHEEPLGFEVHQLRLRARRRRDPQRQPPVAGGETRQASVLAGLAGGAAANSSAFSWTMRWRYVGGDRNSRYHALDAGALTINGKLWIYEKARASASSPLTIQIEVLKENDEKNVLCTLTVVPSTILNDKKEFSKTCGRIETGKYWVRITKPGATNHDGDGWHNQGAGTLATTN